MKSIFNYCIFLALTLFSSISSLAEEIKFQLESHQKLTGTYSGDIDQKTSVHLAMYKDNNTGTYGVKSFYINENDKIFTLDDISVKEEPSIISYHFNQNTSNLTLLIKQGKKNDQHLEIIDLNINTKTVSRNSLADYEDAYLVIREIEKTFLIYKEDKKNKLEIKTIYDSQKDHKETFSFSGKSEEIFKRIFKSKPESINTYEFVENGSIQPSKVYYTNDQLIFDHSFNQAYSILSIHPEDQTATTFQEFSLRGLKIKAINSYIYGSKAFLFINNKKDLNLRSYDLEKGELIADVFLQKDFPHYFDVESLEKIIKKSSRKAFSLTGTVNEGVENSMVVNIDFVPTNNYNYNYNWWWHHQFLRQQMMWQNQMMQQHMRMQMNTFGPNPDSYLPEVSLAKKTQSIKLVIDKDFNFIDGKNAESLRPKIDKDKHIKDFEDNRKLKDVTIAFTEKTARAIFYSKTSEKIHIKSIDL